MKTLPRNHVRMVLTGHGGLEKYEWHEQWPDASARTNGGAHQSRGLWAQ